MLLNDKVRTLLFIVDSLFMLENDENDIRLDELYVKLKEVAMVLGDAVLETRLPLIVVNIVCMVGLVICDRLDFFVVVGCFGFSSREYNKNRKKRTTILYICIKIMKKT